MDPIAIGNFLMYTGALGALLTFVIGLMRKYWRMENSHLELMAEKDKRLVDRDAQIVKLEKQVEDWQRAYQQAAQQGDQAITLAHKVKQ